MGAPGAQRRASQDPRPPPRPQSAPYLVLCSQHSAGFQARSAGRQKSLCTGSRGQYPSPPNRSPSRPRSQARTLSSPGALSQRSICAIRQPGPALLRRGSGNRDPPRETPSKGRERPASPGLQAAARTRNQSPEKKGGGGRVEPRSEATADQAPPKSFALLSPRPSIRGGGRRLHSPHAHHRSRRARRADGARPPDAPPLPGPRQQPNPAQITPAESPGGSPRGPLLLHRI
ncbi:hypothetical protein NDU88_005705 [Pleurodeles waltl]|uniref:Uncharacterized protein n=1 Tax=Pleurodeles waltl TaxID=8319 RepID=A0AAV7RMF0_PLEWA|nr:hypothetical protein NDU88_005705 [Pleurodeles waltl]